MKFKRTALTLLLIIIAVGSVIGGTFAWFTDSVTSTDNTVQSGVLDMDVGVVRGGEYLSLSGDNPAKLFPDAIWEPGYMAMETIRIKNNGNLTFDYHIDLRADETTTASPDDVCLADVIDVYILLGDQDLSQYTREDILSRKNATDGNIYTDWFYCGTLSDSTFNANIHSGLIMPYNRAWGTGGEIVLDMNNVITVHDNLTCTYVLHMQEEAGNEYQNLTMDNIVLDAKAKQSAFILENDAFGHQYDKDATWPDTTNTNNGI